MAALLLLASLLLFCLFCYTHIIQPVFLSPLSKIPNAHPSASFSPLWILYQRWISHELSAIHRAHTLHGPVIRLGPNELSVSSVDGLRTVYAGGSFDKHVFYPRLFANYDAANMFSTVHSKPHAHRKRMLAHIYSKSTVQTSPALAAQAHILVQRNLLPRLRRLLAQSESAAVDIDVHPLSHALAADSTTAYIFGYTASSRFMDSSTSSDGDARLARQLHLFHCRRPYAFYAAETPGLTRVLSHIPFLRERIAPRFAADATQQLEAWGLDMMAGAEKALTRGAAPIEDTPVVYAQLRGALLGAPKEAPLDEATRLLLASEALDHVGAGQETSGITLTYALWQLARHPGMQTALREEVTPYFTPHATAAASPKTLDGLPLLNAVLVESLRLHAAIPGPQPRIPSTSKPARLGPETLVTMPLGTRVSAQAYTLHRNASVFPSPETWAPERWLLPRDEEHRRDMWRHFWAFGSGGRMCIGSNLATQTLKLVVASIVAEFVLRLPLRVAGGDEMLEQEDAYVARPKAMRCVLQFESVHGAGIETQ